MDYFSAIKWLDSSIVYLYHSSSLFIILIFLILCGHPERKNWWISARCIKMTYLNKCAVDGFELELNYPFHREIYTSLVQFFVLWTSLEFTIKAIFINILMTRSSYMESEHECNIFFNGNVFPLYSYFPVQTWGRCCCRDELIWSSSLLIGLIFSL